MWKLRTMTRRRLITILSLVFVLALTTTTALAGSIHFSSLQFKLGSLIVDGRLVGLGTQDVAVILDATGIPVVSCTNQGGQRAPGQNPPKVSASGTQFLMHQEYDKNGSTRVTVETNNPVASSGKKMGCPSNSWTAGIDFVFWTNATIEVRAGSVTGAILFHQDFVCTTTQSPPSVNCTPT